MSLTEQVRVSLPRDMCAPARGREAVRSLLGDHVLPSCISDAMMATSELVTNALIHTHGALELGAEFDRQTGLLRVEVSDSSSDLPTPRERVPDTVGGLGLRLVAELSSAWGCALHESGKTVWFELRCESAMPAYSS